MIDEPALAAVRLNVSRLVAVEVPGVRALFPGEQVPYRLAIASSAIVLGTKVSQLGVAHWG